MTVLDQIIDLLDHVMQLEGRAKSFNADTALLGDLPELDSMAVVAVITGLEEQFDFIIDDDEIDAEVFETVGSLVAFVEAKLA